MDPELQALQREVSRLRRSGWRGPRDDPRELRDRIIVWAQRQVRAGTAVARLSRDLGVPLSTVTAWTTTATPARAKPAAEFREVKLSLASAVDQEPKPGGPIVLVTPHGFRVEGLRVAELAELFRALS